MTDAPTVTTTTTEEPATVTKSIRAGAVEAGGKVLWPDARGAYVPEEMIKAEIRIEDEMVLKVMDFARKLSAEVSRFKAHTFADLASFNALLAQEYGASPRGGPKGNMTFSSFDGLARIEVKVADLIEFGPQLQVAKTLIDECLTEWSSDARPEIRTVVTRAFNVDAAGRVNKGELFRLRTWDIPDDRWKRAMEAIAAATRTVGSKEYIRFSERDTTDGAWRSVTIDLASA